MTNNQVIILAILSEAICLLMAMKIRGTHKLKVEDLVVFGNPVLFPVTIFYFVKSFFKRNG